MKKYLFILFVLPLIWVGCEEPEIKDEKPMMCTFENDTIRLQFALKTMDGEITTVFLKGENIIGHCIIENITNETMLVNYSSSAPHNNIDFGKIYSANNDKLIAYIEQPIGPFILRKKMLAPGGCIAGGFNYPDEWYGSKYQHLEEGKYYTKFKPLFCYYENGAEIDIDIPEFRIDFEVK